MARQSETRTALLFVLPAIALVGLFRMFPLVWGAVLSLTSGDGQGGSQWVGLDNYRRLTTDAAFHDSLINTLILLATLPVFVMLPLLLAILIHQGVPGGKMFRAVYFFPAVLSAVIIGSIFNVVLRYDGSLNAALKSVGIEAVDWLGQGGTAMASLIVVELWATFGMSVLIFLAGLSTVSSELVEAARLDGAKPMQIWWHVILPAMRPILEFVAVVTTIGVLTSMFGLIYVLTAGGPGTSTMVTELYIYNALTRTSLPGVASAVAVMLFVVSLMLTYVLFVVRRRADEEDA